MKLALRIFSDIISIILFILLIANVSKIIQDKEIPSLFNHSYLEAKEDTMADTIRNKDLVVISTLTTDIEDDDIIAYKIGDSFFISRLVSQNGSKCIIKGDNEYEKDEINCSQIVGKSLKNVRGLGFLYPLTTSAPGLIAITIFALVLILIRRKQI